MAKDNQGTSQDVTELKQLVEKLVSDNRAKDATIVRLEENQGVLMKGQKPFTQNDVETAKMRFAELNNMESVGQYEYQLNTAFGEQKIMMRRGTPWLFKCDEKPELATKPEGDENFVAGTVTDGCKQLVIARYNKYSGSEMNPQDMIVTFAAKPAELEAVSGLI